jgi:LmbE family N-acetylglucosaminyl deacetylase
VRGVIAWFAICAGIGLLLWLELRTAPQAGAERMEANGARVLSAKKVVAVVAHPDDAEYWIAGTLKLLGDNGARVVLVVASDGERGRNLLQAPDLSSARRQEQAAAGAVMGYDEIVFLGQPDRSAADGPDVRRLIREVLEQEHPDLVITFDGVKPQLPYLHPDHESIGRFTVSILEATGNLSAIYLFHTRRPDTTVNIASVADAKVEAMRKHVSQNGGRSMGKRQFEYFRAFRKI